MIRFKQLLVLLLVCSMVFVCGIKASATTLDVGLGHTFSSIQSAIDAACDGDEVIVYPGTYVENINFGGKSITVRSIDNDAASTIIDGNGAGSVVTFDQGEGSNSMLEGFTLQNGNGKGDNKWMNGGYNPYGGDGGGIYCESSSPTITNCTISGNSARYGGGIYCNSSSPTIANCTISKNSANDNGRGGGIFCYSSSSPTITGCTISGNSAGSGAGGISCNSSSPTITNCTISGNSAGYGGGGIFCHQSSSTSITNCTISGNSAVYAGGICCDSSSATITNCTISENSASGQAIGAGGGGGGIYCDSSSPTITGCTISENSAPYGGGGIYCQYYSSPTITNCTISGNSVDSSGGGISCWLSSSPTITNCILWNDSPPEIYSYDSNSNPTITYSNIKGGYTGIGNINADPLFVNPDAGDYHLRSGSPCIDAGTSADVPVADKDGNPRDSNPDMGAYEFGSSPIPPTLPDITVTFDVGHSGHTFSSIQKAIDAACDGDEVIVYPGTYVENINFGGKAITVRSIDNDAASTIIDGNGAGNVVTFDQGEGSNSMLEGFTLQNGKGANYGGGISCDSSSPTITNCTISGNSAHYGGGGIYCQSSSATITNCTISENSADINSGGGGISCFGSSPAITNCTISGNLAGGGGGIYCYSSSPTITNCTISGNSSVYYGGGGGGIYCNSSSSPTITNCTISKNSAGQYGGGIYCINSSPIITNCAISENSTHYGGGIYCESSSPAITNCTISENSAGDGYGGGICCFVSSPAITNCAISENSAGYYGGGIYCYSSSSPIITNCAISENSADYGGGGITCNSSSSPIITNCTISENSAGDGGGISCHYSSSPTITNCILWNDSPTEIYIDAVYGYDSNPTVAYSDIKGGYTGIGNINADPLFVNPDAEDYHLQFGSPCIDAGTSDDAPVADKDGNPRDSNPDMGAYEFASSVTSPECAEDDSGAVDIEGINGKAGNEVRIPVRIQSAPNAATSLGFEVTYDASVLEYSGFERGDLVTTFTMFDVNPSGSGKVRVAGLDTGNGFSQGKTGYLLYLKFTVIGGQENGCYPLQLGTLKDHVANFSKTGGCFCISSCNGDLNGDGEITPLDALIAFKCYLGSGPCPDCTDVNRDGEITPLDALCLFKEYLGQPSCLD